MPGISNIGGGWVLIVCFTHFDCLPKGSAQMEFKYIGRWAISDMKLYYEACQLKTKDSSVKRGDIKQLGTSGIG